MGLSVVGCGPISASSAIGDAEQALEAAKAAFGVQRKDDAITPDTELPTVTIKRAELAEPVMVLALLADNKILASRGEARKMIKNGGVKINGEKVADDKVLVGADQADEYGQIIVRIGKKRIHRIQLED